MNKHDNNPDPITGAPGSHPVGVAAGGTAGAIAGAAVGSLFGPIGTLIGGGIGAIGGASGGKAIAERVDPTAEVEYWREGAVSLEDDAVRRLTLGIFGDRQALEALRTSQPWHSWEQLAVMPRHALPSALGAQLDGLAQTLGADARQWWLSELALDAQRALPAGRAPRAHWLGLDLVRLLEGESPGQGGARCEAAPGRARLRALTARQDAR